LVPSICYRKILQEFAQKEHYPLPCYSTRKAKINDCVAFISTVEIGREIFVGKPRGEKKKAKMNAAKVACQHFEESKS
jgi:dsRNA-specific ribonuclease